MNYLGEVKTFASLNHPNIVQYKAAWLELCVPSTKNALKPPDISTESSSSNPKPRSKLKNSTNKKSTSDFTVEFEYSKVYSHSNENYSPTRSRDSRHSISEGGQAMCKINSEDLIQDLTNPHQNWATLFIQMGLCQITLKNWLENRNYSHDNDLALVQIKNQVQSETVMEILRQLLCGIHYIHSKNVVHHDIKPSNIFLQFDAGSLCVQLGDFGLACPLQNTKHSLALGTKLYAAPEQLKGNCNRKVSTLMHYT